MYLAYWSDLHLTRKTLQEFKSYLDDMGYQDCLLILAGDICHISMLSEFISIIEQYFDVVLFVPGNHDFWGCELNKALRIMRSKQTDKFKLLYNSSHEYNGVKFSGTTLFTKLDKSVYLAEGFSDFNYIKEMTVRKWHNQNKKAIDFIINSNADVIITHHAPFLESVTPKFIGDKYNEFFLNDLSDITDQIKTVKYWFNGHVHHKHHYVKNGISVHCNPKGYRGEENNVIDFVYLNI